MKSLYESILSSTNTGKLALLTVNYLLGLGQIPYSLFYSFIQLKIKTTLFY